MHTGKEGSSVKKKTCLSWLLALALACTPAMAEDKASPSLTGQEITVGIHSLQYPVMEGMENEELQNTVNQLLMQRGQLSELTGRMAQVLTSPVPLTETWEASGHGGVVSVVYELSGPLETLRRSHAFLTCNLDLTDGHEIQMSELFKDMDAARESLEEYLQFEVLPDLSAHMMNTDLIPIPETFAFSPSGLTLFYPMERLQTLSDRAGAVTLCWYELKDQLNLEPGSVLDRLGVPEMLELSEASAAQIAECVSRGQLPGIPAELGESMTDVLARMPAAQDPDDYEGGRMVLTEDSRMRQVWLLTDALHEKSFEGSRVEGIRASRMNCFGLCTWQTPREAWLEALGEPDSSLVLTEEQALMQRLEPGTLDYYTFSEHRLCLHAGTDGVLDCLMLLE